MKYRLSTYQPFLIATALGFTFLFSSGAIASSRPIPHYTYKHSAVSGKRTRLGASAHVKSDCALDKSPTVQVIDQPKHGKITFVKEASFSNKFLGKYRKCADSKVSGTTGYYTSTPGYVGNDELTIRTPVNDGHLADITLKIKVVK